MRGVCPPPHQAHLFLDSVRSLEAPDPVPLFWEEEPSEGREGAPPAHPQPEAPNSVPVRGFSPAPRTTWLAITLALVFLLLISTVANVSLFLGSRAARSRHLDGAYVYHPLQEMNGELLAAEKEQPGDTCNPFKD